MSARRQFGIAVATVLATCCMSSCTGSHPADPVRHRSAASRAHGATMTLQIMPAPYQLPAAVSREVLLPAAGGMLIIGGVTPAGVLVRTGVKLHPGTGGTRPAGRPGCRCRYGTPR